MLISWTASACFCDSHLFSSQPPDEQYASVVMAKQACQRRSALQQHRLHFLVLSLGCEITSSGFSLHASPLCCKDATASTAIACNSLACTALHRGSERGGCCCGGQSAGCPAGGLCSWHGGPHAQGSGWARLWLPAEPPQRILAQAQEVLCLQAHAASPVDPLHKQMHDAVTTRISWLEHGNLQAIPFSGQCTMSVTLSQYCVTSATTASQPASCCPARFPPIHRAEGRVPAGTTARA